MKFFDKAFMSFVGAVGIIVFSGTVSASAAPDCAHQFRELYRIQGEEWKRVSVRDPRQELSDPAYLNNLLESMSESFVPWYETGSPKGSYAEMLRAQHRIMVSGKDGRHKYFGASNRLVNMHLKRSATPGAFRFEKNAPDKPLSITILEYNLEGLVPPKLAELKEARRLAVAARDEAMRTAPRVGGRFASQPPIEPPEVRLSSPGVPEEAWTQLGYSGGELYQTYPSASQLREHYLPALERTLNKIQDFGPVTTGNREAFTALVADYVHLGVKAHPFDIGNFSLIMSHVNYVLSKNGFKGISHGQLDFKALVLDHTDFREVFRRYLEAAQ